MAEQPLEEPLQFPKDDPSEPDWQKLAKDPDYQKIFSSRAIDSLMERQLRVLVDLKKTDPAEIATARARLDAIGMFAVLPHRQVAIFNQQPTDESASRKRWHARLLEKIMEILHG